MFKIFLNFIVIFFIAGLEVSFLGSRFFLNPYLCFLITFSLYSEKKFLLWPILGGIIFDFFSIFNFPIFTLSFLATYLFTNFISKKIISIKDVYSFFIFSVAGVIFYNFVFYIFNNISYLLTIDNFFVVFNRNYLIHLIFNILFVFILLVIFRSKYVKSLLFIRRK